MRRIIFGIILVGIAVSAVAQMLWQPSAESDALFAAGVDLYNVGKYREAIPLFAKSDSLDKAQIDPSSNRRDYSSMWLASCYYKMGDTATAASINANYRFAPVDRRLTVKSDSLSQIGMEYANQGDYAKAVEYLTQCAEIEKSVLGENHIFYGNSINFIALCNSFLGNYSSAIMFCEEALAIIEKTLGKMNSEYVVTSVNLANYNYYMGNYSEAIQIVREALDIIEKIFGKDSPDYAMSLGDLANYNHSIGNYTDAIRLGSEALNILEKTLGGNTPDYALLLGNLAEYNSSIGNYPEAIRLCRQALNIRKEVLGVNHPDYVTSLNNLANYFCNSGSYDEAIHLGKESLDISVKIFGEEHPDYALALNNLADYNALAGNYAEAIKLCAEALNIRRKSLGTNHPYYAMTLNNLANYNSLIGNYAEAIKLGTEALSVIKISLGKEHPYYAISLNTLAACNAFIGKYKEAIKLATEALNIINKTSGTTHSDYATSLANLASYNYHLGNYTEALRLGTEALQIREKVLGKEHPDYAASLSDLANYYSCLGNYTEAIRLGTEALNIRKKVLGESHPDYAKSLNDVAYNNSILGNYADAVRLGKEVLKIQEKVLGKEHPNYAASLSNLASYNSDLGNYLEAIRLDSEALNIRKNVLGETHPEYARSLSNLASYYSSIGNYTEAMRLGSEALQINEKVFGREHPNYAVSLSNLAGYNSSLGYYAEAMRLGTEALQILEVALGKEHPDYATALSNLAGYSSSLGNYTEAMRLGTEALQINEKVFGREHSNYATSLHNLAGYNSSLGNYSEAIRLETKALEIREKLFGKYDFNYLMGLFILAQQYSLSGKYEEAKRWFLEYCNLTVELINAGIERIAISENNKEAIVQYLEIIESYKEQLLNIETFDIEKAIKINEKVLLFGENQLANKNINYEDFLNSMFLLNYFSDEYEKAKRFGIELLHIIEPKLGKEHPNCAIVSSYLSVCNWKTGGTDATGYCVDATEALAGIVRRTFADLTARERNLFWEQYKAWFEGTIHGIAYDMPSDSLAENGYNGALMAKGLLLHSEMELSTLLKESGDEEVANIYNNLKNLRLQINKLYEMPIAERPLDADSLERVAQGLERQLVQRAKVYGDYTANLVIDWKQVRQKLGSGEMAVEFVSFPLRNDSVMYAAYCLRKDMPSPKMVPLFEERQLTSIAKGLYLSSNALYNLIWKPLEDEMAGVTTVYFAPSGELYNLPVENLPVDGSTYNSDLCSYRRLSSTRQLALRRDGVEVARAAVYGGLKYDTDTVTLANDSRKYRMAEPVQWSSRAVADSLNLRGGIYELPATKIEAEEIDKALETAQIDTRLYTDTIGTEASFKALSGSGVNALHIATHGFYWTEREAVQLDGLAFLGADMPAAVKEDKALTRSGLLLAGANTALKGLPLPEGVEDGVLTAKEIAGMDLRRLDLVALSACQTGLGEITGDGVFGLQRGFKKAGANTLLMSLWKVDDTATQLLMTQFYKNLLAGMGKYEALTAAQKYLRELEVEVKITPDKTNYQRLKDERAGKQEEAEYKTVRRYAEPKYWAAFVLLDGVN